MDQVYRGPERAADRAAQNYRDLSHFLLSDSEFEAALAALVACPDDTSRFAPFFRYFQVHELEETDISWKLIETLLIMSSTASIPVFHKICDCLCLIARRSGNKVGVTDRIGSIVVPLFASRAMSYDEMGRAALRVTATFTRQIPSIADNIFSLIGATSLASRVLDCDSMDAARCSMTIFESFVFARCSRSGLLDPSFVRAFIELCNRVCERNWQDVAVSAITGIRILTAHHDELHEMIIEAGIPVHLNAMLSGEKPLFMAAVSVFQQLLRSDRIADVIDMVTVIMKMTDDDEDIGMAACDLIAGFVLKYPAGIIVLVELGLIQGTLELFKEGTVRGKLRALCVLRSLLVEGSHEIRVCCAVPQIVEPLVDMISIVPKPQCGLIIRVLYMMVDVDRLTGGKLGVLTALREEGMCNSLDILISDVQNPSAEDIERFFFAVQAPL